MAGRSTQGWRRRAAIYASLCLAALVLYGASLGNGFVFDDHQIIVNNPRIKNWPADLGLFVSNYWFETKSPTAASPNNYYRPVTLLSFAIDYKLWGTKATGFHLTNIGLFALLLAVLFLLVECSFKDTGLAVLSALVFGANPIHGEVVSFVGGRTDLLAGLFAAATLYQYWRWRQEGKAASLTLSLAFWLLALGSKESAASVPLLIAGMELSLREKGQRLWRREHLLYLAVPAVYAAVRFLALSGNTPWRGDTLDLTAVGTLPEKAWKYLRLTLAPINLSTYYTDRFHSGPALMAGGLLLSILPAAATLMPGARKYKALLLASQFFIWGLVPSLGFVRNTSNVEFAERFAFLSSFGTALALSWAFLAARAKAPGRAAANAVLVLPLAYILWMGAGTVRRNAIWKSDLTLFREMARTAPGSYLAHFNLGNEYARQGWLSEAESRYRRAIELDSSQFDAYNNLGALYFRTGRWEEAANCFERAAELNATSPVIRFNCGLARLRQGKKRQAADWFQKALEQDPGFLPARKAAEALQ